MPEAVRASEGGRNRRAVQIIERILPDISLMGILHYYRFPKQVLAFLAEQTRSLPLPMLFALWDTVKVCQLEPSSKSAQNWRFQIILPLANDMAGAG